MNIASLFGLYTRPNPTPRDYLLGMEFELEDVSDEVDTPEYYEVHGDGSLRNGAEYVFIEPLAGEHVISAIEVMEEFMDEHDFEVSERTSTHIHINMSDAGSTAALCSTMFALVYMIEPAIFRAADENRKWCGYCQPLSDMPQQRVLDLMSEDTGSFRNGVYGESASDRYFGLNMRSLSRHGTIEFRYFPGWVDKDTTISWVNLVTEIRAAAEAIGSVSNMLSLGASAVSLRGILQEVMKTSYSMISDRMEDSEIERRAAHLSAILASSDVPLAVTTTRLASITAGSSMDKFIAAQYGISLSSDGRKAMILAEIVRDGGLSPDLVSDLESVISTTSESDFFDLFRSTINDARSRDL